MLLSPYRFQPVAYSPRVVELVSGVVQLFEAFINETARALAFTGLGANLDTAFLGGLSLLTKGDPGGSSSSTSLSGAREGLVDTLLRGGEDRLEHRVLGEGLEGLGQAPFA